MSASGDTLWILEGEGRPVAVFGGTLFVDDGTVRSTTSGAVLRRWSGSRDGQLRLSDEHAAYAVSCGESCVEWKGWQRRTGELQLHVRKSPDSSPAPRSRLAGLVLGAGGRMVVLEEVNHPERGDSHFYTPIAVRFYDMASYGETTWHGELSFSEGNVIDALLLDDSLLVQHRDALHNVREEDSTSRFHALRIPGLRSPEHGWLGSQGGVGRNFAPR